MIEKIRVSLWDVYTFFLSGFLLVAMLLGHLLFYDILTTEVLTTYILNLPTALSILALPLAFTLLGLLIEPPANYFDSLVLKRVWSFFFKKKKKHKGEQEILKELIRTKYLGSLNGKVEDPYAICKEYVETNDLSTTFMVFLSRYGFYRNVAFLCFIFGVLNIFLCEGWLNRALVLAVFLSMVMVFKHRAEDFFSYMAPSVFRCFFLDKELNKGDDK